MNIIICIFVLVYWIFHTLFIVINIKREKKNKTKIENIEPSIKILVVIPARNEEKRIRDSIKAIKQIKYPKELYSIIALLDQCSDATSDIALDENIIICEDLENNNNSKGNLLRSFFNIYKNFVNNYDCVVLVDADTIIDEDFFIVINNEINKGNTIIQGKAHVYVNKKIINGFMAIYQSIMNIFFYKYHLLKGESVVISGKGAVISREIINEIQWSNETLVEDVDFSFKALLKNYKINYCERLSFHIWQPDNLKDMWNQQRRWISGQIQIMRFYSKKLCMTELNGGAKSFIRIGFANFFIPCLIITLLLEDLKVFMFLFILYYIIAVFTAMIVSKYDQIKNLSLKSIFCFPLVLLFLYFICLISFLCPRKKWYK